MSLWIELRSDIARDVGVGNRHTVDQPLHLMAASHMQLIVHHVGARDEVGDMARPFVDQRPAFD